MRVISGIYKGKKINGFDIMGTRPTMDRVKESLFASIQNYIPNSTCLDLFAGSGSLGIEALSMGAKKCYFVDKNREIYEILTKNLNGIKGAIAFNNDYEKALSNIKEKVDIVFLDPPYKMHLIKKVIKKLIELKILNENALIVCEFEDEKVDFDFEIIKEKKYGTKNIIIYRYSRN